VIITAADREELLRRLQSSTTPDRVTVRTALVLLASAGWSDSRIAAALGVTRRTVALWRSRYIKGGCSALLVDAPGRGRKPGRNREIIEKIRAKTSERPIQGQRWTVRSLARAVGVSHATVHRVCREQHFALDGSQAH
jgi:transposase